MLLQIPRVVELLRGAASRTQVELDGNPAHRDFLLKPAKDVTKQMTGADWFASLPEETIQDRRIKDVFKTSCTGCHMSGR